MAPRAGAAMPALAEASADARPADWSRLVPAARPVVRQRAGHLLEVAAGAGVPRVDAARARLEGIAGRGQVALLRQRDAEVVVPVGVTRGQRDRLTQRPHRIVEAALVDERAAVVDVELATGPGAMPIARSKSASAGRRLAAAIEPGAEVVHRAAVERIDGQRPLVVRPRLVPPVLPIERRRRGCTRRPRRGPRWPGAAPLRPRPAGSSSIRLRPCSTSV